MSVLAGGSGLLKVRNCKHSVRAKTECGRWCPEVRTACGYLGLPAGDPSGPWGTGRTEAHWPPATRAATRARHGLSWTRRSLRSHRQRVAEPILASGGGVAADRVRSAQLDNLWTTAQPGDPKDDGRKGGVGGVE